MDILSTDEDSFSHGLDSDVYISSGEVSHLSGLQDTGKRENNVGEDEISDLLSSLKLRDKSGEENRNPNFRHSYHAPPTHNEIRKQELVRFVNCNHVSPSVCLNYRFELSICVQKLIDLTRPKFTIT